MGAVKLTGLRSTGLHFSVVTVTCKWHTEDWQPDVYFPRDTRTLCGVDFFNTSALGSNLRSGEQMGRQG